MRVEWLDADRPCDAGDCPGEDGCPEYWECRSASRVPEDEDES
jgi:hypothetical protein